MKRLIPLLLIFSLLLCGCNGAEEAPTTTAAPTTEATTAPTTEPTEAPTEAPTEPVPTFRHPLNGSMLEEPFTGRLAAFSINNANHAMPQHSISQADVLYEICVEGGVTRCLAIFSDLSEVERIGSLRSARTYFISLSMAYNAVLVHSGLSTFAANKFNATGWDHVNDDSKAYYRDPERKSAGYIVEDTQFTTGERISEYLQKTFEMTASADANYGFIFEDELKLDGETAKKIQVNFGPSGYVKTTNFTYNAETNTYAAYQHGKDYIDGNTDEVLNFTNVLVLQAVRTHTGSSAGNVLHQLTGENSGYYACGGKIVPIKWSREEETDHFTYTLEDGTPLTMRPGTTYIGVVPATSPVDFE